ncbi:MAG: hypothetical protein MK193_10230 [Lentisphaeria bacterium]|nr:hypothetical protein [Lentisphaeria bacterium]
MWYKNFPLELSEFLPNVVSFSCVDSYATLEMEHFPFYDLGHFYRRNLFSYDQWEELLDRLFRINCDMKKKSDVEKPQVDFNYIYLDKIKDRLKALSKQSPFWAHLLKEEMISINGKLYKGFLIF